MSGVINAPSRACHMSGNIMWSVGKKFLYTLKFFCRWVCPGICYTEVLGSQKLVEVRSAANSVCFIRVTEDFYVTQIKTWRFHTSSLSMTTPNPFSQLPKSLDLPTQCHLHLLRTKACMQEGPWIQMGKNIIPVQDMTLHKENVILHALCRLY